MGYGIVTERRKREASGEKNGIIEVEIVKTLPGKYSAGKDSQKAREQWTGAYADAQFERRFSSTYKKYTNVITRPNVMKKKID